MPIALRFNGKKFYDDLYEELRGTMLQVVDRFFREAISGLSSDGKMDSDKDGIVEALDTYIRAQCSFYADAIVDSYGTGSLSDTGEHSHWDEYEDSEYFNSARHGTRNIVGRPRSWYTDLWGNKQRSSGRNRGKNLEGIYITEKETGELVYIEPQKPSYAIQRAEAWLMQNDRQTYMERAIERAVEQFIGNMNPLDYYYYMDV